LASFVSVRKRLGGILSQPPGDRDSSVAIYHEGIMCVVDHPRELHLENAVELLRDTVNIELVVWHCFLPLPASAWPPPTPKSLQRLATQGTAADCRPGRRNDSRARPPARSFGSGSGRLAAAWARKAASS